MNAYSRLFYFIQQARIIGIAGYHMRLYAKIDLSFQSPQEWFRIQHTISFI